MRRAYSSACGVLVVLVLLARPCHGADRADQPMRAPAHWVGLTPSWTHAFVAHSVSHEAVGLDVEARLGRRLAIALVGTLYSPFQRSYLRASSTSPLNETLGSVLPEARVTLLRGDRAELAIVGGAGVLASRPVSLVDPEHRTFGYQARIVFAGGAVARVFLLHDLAVSLEARHAIYGDAREADAIAESARRDPATWYGERPLTNMIETRLGVTLFLSEK